MMEEKNLMRLSSGNSPLMRLMNKDKNSSEFFMSLQNSISFYSSQLNDEVIDNTFSK